jgi:hypothetical protein
MPDRLRAGLQFLVLTMLVRIQLGQQANPFSKAEGVFCFSGLAWRRLSEGRHEKTSLFVKAKQHFLHQKEVLIKIQNYCIFIFKARL